MNVTRNTTDTIAIGGLTESGNGGIVEHLYGGWAYGKITGSIHGSVIKFSPGAGAQFVRVLSALGGIGGTFIHYGDSGRWQLQRSGAQSISRTWLRTQKT